jgi:hypothetical protein
MTTAQMACPRCHLHIAESMLEVLPLFVSIVGSPASGKSYFLTTMVWELRRLLPRAGLSFSDADPEANSAICDYEQTLFMSDRPDQPVAIRKTQADDPRLHKTARISGTDIRFPLPLQFAVWPTKDHPYRANPYRVGRVVVLYDNAGEDCLPGAETPNSMAVQHLARSGIVFMLFDPAQDGEFRKLCRTGDPQLDHGLRPGGSGPRTLMRQEIILNETAVRIRRYLGLGHSERIRQPLVIIVSKFDMLADASGVAFDTEPYLPAEPGHPLRIDMGRIEATSQQLRDLFLRTSPNFVATADALSENVRYIPVSSLGHAPTRVAAGDQEFYGIRPDDVRPRWVTVPMIYCMSRWARQILDLS